LYILRNKIGVDYTTSIAIGRLIFIDHYSFNYEKFYEEVEDQFDGVDIILSYQKYKGKSICTGLFVGSILDETDPINLNLNFSYF